MTATTLCILLVVTVACITTKTSDASTVTIPGQGPVTGSALGSVEQFLGIPFSAPPVGDLRWKAPVDHAVWTTSMDAVTPKLCYQHIKNNAIGSEEDCNNVNIWVPENNGSPGADMPVLVWIHGGSYTDANPNLSVYNGTHLAAKSVNSTNQPTIVMSIQYRMGGLGFMGHDKLKTEDGSHASSGNYAVLDMLKALQWIQDKISAFGGDPNRVTIFGESAGAYSVCTLLASPLATGLFSGAIAESPYCANSYLPAVYAEGAGKYCSSKNNCASSSDEMGCLRALSVQDAYACTTEAYANAPKPSGLGQPGLLQVMPNVDGYVLPDAPLLSIAKGTCPSGKHKMPSVPTIFGTNAQEMMAFAALGIVPGLSSTPAHFTDWIQLLFAQTGLSLSASAIGETGADVGLDLTTAKKLAAMYTEAAYTTLTTTLKAWVGGGCLMEVFSGALCEPNAITNTYRRIIAMGTDQLFTSTAAALSSAMVGRNLRTYRYLFNQAASGDLAIEALGPFHGIDVPFVFGTFTAFAATWSPTDEIKELSDQMQKYWLNFANTGDPNKGTPVTHEWLETKESNGDQYLQIEAENADGSGGSSNSNGYRLSSVEFWRDFAFKSMPTMPAALKDGDDPDLESNAGALVALIVVILLVFGVIYACKRNGDNIEAIKAVKDASATAGSAHGVSVNQGSLHEKEKPTPKSVGKDVVDNPLNKDAEV